VPDRVVQLVILYFCEKISPLLFLVGVSRFLLLADQRFATGSGQNSSVIVLFVIVQAFTVHSFKVLSCSFSAPTYCSAQHATPVYKINSYTTRPHKMHASSSCFSFTRHTRTNSGPCSYLPQMTCQRTKLISCEWSSLIALCRMSADTRTLVFRRTGTAIGARDLAVSGAVLINSLSRRCRLWYSHICAEKGR